MNCLSLPTSLLTSPPVLDGGLLTEVGGDNGDISSSYLTLTRFDEDVFLSWLLLVTTLLLLLCFLVFRAGESCSAIGGLGGDCEGHANKPGWKKAAGFAWIPSPDAAIN